MLVNKLPLLTLFSAGGAHGPASVVNICGHSYPLTPLTDLSSMICHYLKEKSPRYGILSMNISTEHQTQSLLHVKQTNI